MDYDQIIEENTGLIVSVVNLFKITNEADREDLIQEGRMGLWKALQKYNPDKSKISTFCRQSIFWQVSTAVQKMNKHRKYGLNKVSLQNYDADYEECDVLSEYIPQNLSDMDRKIVEYKIQGHSFKEISNEVNKSIGYVKKRFYGVMKRIQKIHG